MRITREDLVGPLTSEHHLVPALSNGTAQHVTHDAGRDVLVLHLHDELGVVELLQLGRHGEPEPGTTAAHEGRDRLEHVAGVALHGMFVAVLRRHVANDLLGLLRHVVGGGQRRRIPEPDVNV